ncbi:alpha/beta hydrolase [Legionella fairfieldensis]|uniref:alpha/beta hydrolase n=1 Tax=Legionella fairfieldensis TaxID=45064 RepID=UPI000491FA16|nr:alpha/beta fold hydrolase [Legionella fairfieldensis]
MNIDDFRCIRKGVHLSTLDDISLIAPINRLINRKKHRALLLLHGFSSTPAVFRYLLPTFSNYDTIVGPTLSGHGTRLNDFACVKASDWLLQIEQICKTLTDQFDQVDVMGLSLGGLLACHLSTRFNLHHLYLLAPALDLRLELKNTLKLAKSLHWLGFRQIRSYAGDLFTSQHCEIAYRQLPISTIIEMLTFVQQFQFYQPDCPADLFLGCHDKVVSSWRVADRFADNNKVNIHWLANSAHVIPLDGDIDQIAECVQQTK